MSRGWRVGFEPATVSARPLPRNGPRAGALVQAAVTLESRRRRGSDGAVLCLIASAPHEDTFGYSMPPPGLLRLGGELRRRGLPVALDDLAFRLAAGEARP